MPMKTASTKSASTKSASTKSASTKSASMRAVSMRAARSAALLVGALVALAGCSSSHQPSATGSPTPAVRGAAPASAFCVLAGQQQQLTETELPKVGTDAGRLAAYLAQATILGQRMAAIAPRELADDVRAMNDASLQAVRAQQDPQAMARLAAAMQQSHVQQALNRVQQYYAKTCGTGSPAPAPR
jgi:hypothetical protein